MTPIEIGGLRPVNHDFGIVEALPTQNLAIGATCTFKAAAGVYWRLVYTGDETYPWAKIGGPPLRADYTAAENVTTTSETAQTTNAPKLTIPSVKMEADVQWGASLTFAEIAGAQPRMYLYVAGAVVTPENNAWAAGGAGSASSVGGIGGRRRLALASAVEVQARYRRFGVSGAVNFYTPYLEIDPLRVG